MKSGKAPFILFALLDTVFVLLVIIIFSVFNYWAENGRVRYYIFISAALGFFVYYNTVGRAVMLVSEKIAELVKRLFSFVIVRPAAFIIKKSVLLLGLLYSHTLGRLFAVAKRAYHAKRTEKYLKALEDDISFDENNSRRRGK